MRILSRDVLWHWLFISYPTANQARIMARRGVRVAARFLAASTPTPPSEAPPLSDEPGASLPANPSAPPPS